MRLRSKLGSAVSEDRRGDGLAFDAGEHQLEGDLDRGALDARFAEGQHLERFDVAAFASDFAFFGRTLAQRPSAAAGDAREQSGRQQGNDDQREYGQRMDES